MSIPLTVAVLLADGTEQGDVQGARQETSATSPEKSTSKRRFTVLLILSATVVVLAVGTAKYADAPPNADGLQRLVEQVFINLRGKPGLKYNEHPVQVCDGYGVCAGAPPCE
ncbi:hypothetical protein P3T76_014625 [Phytophthora citrophthora]|uniref:Uncharacterized protein n=1 Tax=Phytophthora citrophthora TaxID=4793 RepID=A0AAD9G1I8_9STRA|nr:hypothetical protein P3T76_014625 [Phytophthora citrophthora]